MAKHGRGGSPTHRVAIVVPISNRPDLTPSEEISLRHLRHHLGHYKKYIVAPEGLQIDFPDFDIARFAPSFFGSAANYKRMVMSREFYERFADYEYILTYHLDALVFSDQLQAWCEKGYDFIGPPWVSHPDSPNQGTVYEGKVGNTGFCLKKVQTFIELFDDSALDLIRAKALRFLLRRRPHCATWEAAHWRLSEERFLVERASHYLEHYNVAPLEEAIRFGFEVAPRYCMEITGGQLPFGCHAWERYDRQFWEPFLLSASDRASTASPGNRASAV